MTDDLLRCHGCTVDANGAQCEELLIAFSQLRATQATSFWWISEIIDTSIKTEAKYKMEKLKKSDFVSWITRVRNAILSELGIEYRDIESFPAFVKVLNSPRDPSGLAVIRILFGILMIIDVHHERGLSRADDRWGNINECRFPLFWQLRPLPLQWMILLYLVMLLGAAGIVAGYRYRYSCLCFLLPYWYIFLLDKSHWNNHSYLFGLISIQLALSEAHRCWSYDGRHNPRIKNTHVPLWNYALLRGQIFLVYFIAGLKKTNLDWIGGYSMEKLGYHWVFDGFRLFLTGDQITYLVVHLGGFLLDLTVGFFMLMKSTRYYAFVFCGLFNLMNSRMFSIGMFPYVMIAIMPIFCDADWPKRCLTKLPKLQKALSYDSPPGINSACIYSEDEIIKNDNETSPSKRKKEGNKIRFRHQATAIVFCSYFALQAFLPYSHWLTKGYNTWTQGLYGYSWDMMVHNWRYVHTTITVVDKDTGKFFHVDPEFWAPTHRWTHHADMVKQLAHCVDQEMKTKHGFKDIAVHIDVWSSLNRRFIQRMYDPTVDMIQAKWSPFEQVDWVMPLQSELTGWRKKLMELEEDLFNKSENVDVAFVADFPGFSLVNYIVEDFSNISLEVLKGTVEVQVPPNQTMKLEEGQEMQIPVGEYHRVLPKGDKPACYMYIYHLANKTNLISGENYADFWHDATCPIEYQNIQLANRELTSACLFCWEQWKMDFVKKLKIWIKSVSLIGQALYSIITQSAMDGERTSQIKEL